MGCVGSKAKDAPAAVPLDAQFGQVFLFVNGSSGGQASQKLLDLDVDSLEFDLTPKGSRRVATVWFFNMKDATSRSAGFAKLRDTVERQSAEQAERGSVRAVACGGDGTVKWVISELAKVNSLQVPIGVIPFGTGNDFSRAMGWGASAPSPLIGRKNRALFQRLEKVMESDVSALDVWNCAITVREGTGSFTEVKDGKVVPAYEGERTINHEMMNYFSVGADAEIVFNFEQHRTKTQFGNKRVYVRKGADQIINPPRRLRAMLKDLRDEAGDPIKYKHGHRVLAFLNIPSYSAGANLWHKSSKTGRFGDQQVGDGVLEAVSVRSTTHVALHIGTGSNLGIKRTAQRGGYTINFLETQAYVQIDGEAISCEGIEKIEITPAFKVTVLRSKQAIADHSPVKSPDAPDTPVFIESSKLELMADPRAVQRSVRLEVLDLLDGEEDENDTDDEGAGEQEEDDDDQAAKAAVEEESPEAEVATDE